MYFSAGLIEARAGEIESARLLSRIENAIVCSGYHVSLLIWSVNHPSWSSVSKRFLRAIPSGSFGVIMFKTALHSNISPNSRGYSTSRARSPTRNTSKQSMPDFFDRDLQTVNHDFAGTSPLVRKRSTTKKVHESEEEFSRDMMTQQKKPLLQESAKTSSPANITKPSEMVTNSEKAITKTSRDPRAPSRDRVSPATGLTHVTPTIPSISLFSFVDFCKYFMARVPHTKESAMKIFKEKLNIDWRNMVRYDKPIIYAFVQYPPKVVSRELSVLKEFLHAIRAHEYYANVHSHWAALQPLIKSRPWHHGKENRAIVKDKFDPDKHVRVHTGNDAVILVSLLRTTI